MATHEIDIRLGTTYDGRGAEQGVKHVGKMTKAVGVLTKGMGDLGGVFNSTVRMITQGAVWEAAAMAIRQCFDYALSLGNQTEILQRQIDRAARENEKFFRTFDAAAKKSAETYAEAVKGINAETAARQKSISLLNDELHARLELEKATRLAAGENAAAVEKDVAAKRKSGDFDAKDEQYDNAITGAQARIADAQQRLKALRSEQSALRDREQSQTRKLKRDRAEAATKMRQLAEDARSWNPIDRVLANNQEDSADRYVKKIEDEVAALNNVKSRREANSKAIQSVKAEIAAAQAAIEEAQKGKGNIATLRAAAEKEAIYAENEERRKADEAAAKERERLAKAEADARAAADREAAKERERLDREAHRKRMDDLREEIAAQRDAQSRLSVVRNAAQTEFERAFSMYRDPSRAAAQIGEERARQGDLDRLHRDAGRYGGKWRIDELASLMSGGDSEGVSKTLERYRKNASFTPEVEAMVRASAAEKTRDLAEQRMNEIAANLADLAAAQKDASDKTAEISSASAAIRDNTANLANKIDQLLQVKG